MNIRQIALGFSLLSASAMLGCGNGVEDDPLAGEWSNDKCFGSASKPADVESCAVALSLTDALEVELDATWISLAATETNPGCTTTRSVTGQVWSADHATNTMTVSGKGVSTLGRTDCVIEEDNLEAEETTDISLIAGEAVYEINSDSLTILSGSLKGTYTR
jgi:hypothetical protein